MTKTIVRAGTALTLIGLLAACEQGMGPTASTAPMNETQPNAPVQDIAEPTDTIDDEAVMD